MKMDTYRLLNRPIGHLISNGINALSHSAKKFTLERILIR